MGAHGFRVVDVSVRVVDNVAGVERDAEARLVHLLHHLQQVGVREARPGRPRSDSLTGWEYSCARLRKEGDDAEGGEGKGMSRTRAASC